MHNQLQELKGNIRVICRVRPFLGKEVGGDTEYEFSRSVWFSVPFCQRVLLFRILSKWWSRILLGPRTFHDVRGLQTKEKPRLHLIGALDPMLSTSIPGFASLSLLNKQTSRRFRRNFTPCSKFSWWLQLLHFCIRSDWFGQNLYHGRTRKAIPHWGECRYDPESGRSSIRAQRKAWGLILHSNSIHLTFRSKVGNIPLVPHSLKYTTRKSAIFLYQGKNLEIWNMTSSMRETVKLPSLTWLLVSHFYS